MVRVVALLLESILTLTVTVLTSITVFISLIIWFRNYRESLRRDKKLEPLIEKHKQEMEVRRKKLESFTTPRIPLYYNDELLDTLFSQSQLKKSPVEIDTIKKVSTIEGTQGIDAKFLSFKGKKAESEELILKEIRNREMKYIETLTWLYDNDSLLMGLEDPLTEDRINEEIKKMELVIKRRYSGTIVEKAKEALRTVILSSFEEAKFETIESVQNKFIVVQGDFLVNPDVKNIHLVFRNNLKFHVDILNDYCTMIGEKTFAEVTSIRIGVFGYISGVDKKTYALKIEPITIHRLSP